MDKIQSVLVIVGILTFAASVTFSYLNTSGSDLFFNGVDVLDEKYNQQVTPKPVIFAIIWPIIYLWNAVGAVYLFVSLFLHERNSPVKMDPTLVTKPFLVSYSLLWVMTVGWLFAYDREMVELSLALVILGAASASFAVGASYKRLSANVDILEKENKVVLWMMRIVIQNGLCIAASWLTAASLINVAVVIIYKNSFGISPVIERGVLSKTDASTVSLIILMVIVIGWFVVENFVWEKYCRYTFTVYPVFILALSALIVKLSTWPNAERNLIIASVNLGLAVVASFARIALTIWRWRKRSIASVPVDGLT